MQGTVWYHFCDNRYMHLQVMKSFTVKFPKLVPNNGLNWKLSKRCFYLALHVGYMRARFG